MIVGFFPVLLHPLRVDLLLYGLAILHEKVFRLLIIDPPHVFRDLIYHRLEAMLLLFSLILLTFGSLDHARKFCLSLHAPPVELLAIVG